MALNLWLMISMIMLASQISSRFVEEKVNLTENVERVRKIKNSHAFNVSLKSTRKELSKNENVLRGLMPQTVKVDNLIMDNNFLNNLNLMGLMLFNTTANKSGSIPDITSLKVKDDDLLDDIIFVNYYGEEEILSERDRLQILSSAMELPQCKLETPVPKEMLFKCLNQITVFSIEVGLGLCSTTISCSGILTINKYAKDISCVKDPICTAVNKIVIGGVKIFEKRSTIDKFLEHKVVQNSVKPCFVNGLSTGMCDEGTEMKSLQINLVSLDSKKFFYMNELSLANMDSPLEIESYTCEGKECVVGNKKCSEGGCAGNLNFCKAFGCTHQADCKCEFDQFKVNGFLNIDKKMIPISILSSFMALIPTGNVLKQAKPFNCSHCGLTCTGNIVKFDFRGEKIEYMIIFKNSIPKLVTKVGLSGSITLNNDYLRKDQTLLIRLWTPGNSIPYERHVSCPEYDQCLYINCFWCFDNWGNVNCYSHRELTVIVSSLLITIGMFITLLKYIFKRSKQTTVEEPGTFLIIWLWLTLPFTFIKSIVYYLWLKTFGRIHGDIKSRARLNRETRRIPIERIHRRERVPYGTEHLKKSLLVISLIFVIDPALCCTRMEVMSVKQEICENGLNGTKTCSFNQVSRLSGVAIGQTTCLNVRDKEGISIETLIFEPVLVEHKCSYAKMYYTMTPDWKQHARSNCGGVALCEGDKDKCKYFSPTKRQDLWKEYSKNSVAAQCFFDCGCLGCGCFRCTASCIWCLSVLSPKNGIVYEVGRCDSWSLSFSFKFSKLSNNKRDTEEFSLQPGSIKTLAPGLDLSLISLSVPPNPFTDDCIVKEGSRIAIAKCNKESSLVKGLIGEVQCPTEFDALTASDSCVYNDQIITQHGKDWTCTKVTQNQDVDLIVSKNLIPKVTSTGIILNTDINQNIVASFPGNALFDIQITMNNYDIVLEYDRSTCYVDFDKISGCYNCLGGATMELTIWTNFGTALASIECDDLQSEISMDATTEKIRKSITVSFSTSRINSECRVRCPGEMTKFRVVGTLSWTAVSSGMVRGISSSNDNTSFGGFDWRSLIGTWWFTSNLTFIGLILIILVVSTYIIVRKILNRTKSNNKVK